MKVKKKKKKNLFFFSFFLIWEFSSQIWEKHLIFALGIGAEFRPQNRPRKIPDGYDFTIYKSVVLRFVYNIIYCILLC